MQKWKDQINKWWRRKDQIINSLKEECKKINNWL